MDGLRIGNYALDTELAIEIGQKIGLAVIILIITWVLAKAAKWAFAKLVDNIGFLRRDTGSGTSLGESLGKIASLLIWLFGLIAILTVFGLGGVVQPIEGLLNTVMQALPGIVMAVVVFFVGLKIADILRDLVVTALQTFDFDKWANRGGIDTATGNSQISSTIGSIVYALTVIFVAIFALDILDIESISAPASEMLRTIFQALPAIFTAAITLGLGYLISKFVVQIIKDILPGLGVDQSVAAIGILPEKTSLTSILARIAQIGIMLFFAIAATRLLGFPELTRILDQVLELGGRVIFGGVVIMAGFLIANLLARVMSTADEGSMAATIIRYATIILFTFMGLQFMGVGEEIVQTAFTALVIGGAAAAALAFGWGGRDVAGKVLEDLRNNPPKPKAPAARKPAARKPAVRKPVAKK
ncbi:mechanosensitive ion channel [Parasphingorhabdus flavimaris]|uniref:mechanosensitive ion channel n=1 Tax=Parasphingorhabdus flavimaris TaxID=266812 RepID=UPI001FECB9B4|nr:mechanosensitive ion channel [Parasphingorhabdus flavimaris]|tara:strand:- start:21930 stop:23177 length:1248 start_codon:yes stop_codon:yes gene_type:complete